MSLFPEDKFLNVLEHAAKCIDIYQTMYLRCLLFTFSQQECLVAPKSLQGMCISLVTRVKNEGGTGEWK